MLIGIDYSLTCPCICFYEKDRIKFRFLTDTKKYICKIQTPIVSIEGVEHSLWKHPLERYTKIANAVYGEDQELFDRATNINIEDYSMGSKGKVFHIAENTAIIKQLLWSKKLEYKTVPPTVVKKFATGKGNSKKEQMYDAWIKDTGIDLKKLLDQNSEKVASPVSDIVDAYYLATMGAPK